MVHTRKISMTLLYLYKRGYRNLYTFVFIYIHVFVCLRILYFLGWVGGCFSVFINFVFPWVIECALHIVQFPCFFAQRVAAEGESKEAQARSGCH